jgi:adenine-specific DNA-methyltransferase
MLTKRQREEKEGNKNQLVNDYRYEEAQRKNIPPAGIAPTYEVRETETKTYVYDPHLDPQLVWTEKAGLRDFEFDEGETNVGVDVVSLHIHERISTKAILSAAKRPQTLQLTLFAEPSLPLDKQIEFYRHDVDWANRLVLGDCMLVMNSLLVREGMAGKVQMIYIDPPYGIKYSSNFQPRIDKRDVKEKDVDLTREPEQIKAYRDTWKLGIHSYLTYLRDRLLLAKELLHESGSIFVQIGDENLHLVRCIMDEVFGRENFASVITFRKKNMPLGSKYLDTMGDYLLWYAKNYDKLKYRGLFEIYDTQGKSRWTWYEKTDGICKSMNSEQWLNHSLLPQNSHIFRLVSIRAPGYSEQNDFPITFTGKNYPPPRGGSWITGKDGLKRLIECNRLQLEGENISFKLYEDDFNLIKMTNFWTDTAGPPRRTYVVETATTILERCILMTTDPGDLVFDPMCGSGTTTYCAEKWGRRWITCDTSRVAIAIAKQRLLTAKFDYYELRDFGKGPAGGFIYENVPHITLESIAKNVEIDEIAAKYQPEIDENLAELNKIVGKGLKEWETPREIPGDWNEEARRLHEKFWELKQNKQKDIDESIRQNAPQEVLYDKTKIKKDIVRVSGPFTLEAIPVPVVGDPSKAPIPQFEEGYVEDKGRNYLDDMIELLRKNGVTFPGGKKLELKNLRPVHIGWLHAEAEAEQNGKSLRVAISFGPQYGPVTATQVAEAIPVARNNAYDLLIFAGFGFDPEAQAFVQKAPVANLQIHFANVSPDVLVGDLLKTTRGSQLFTVFGQPDVAVEKEADTYVVNLRGVDIYDPNTGETYHARGEDVAAWFLDTDYDGLTFHICQAFFPGGGDPWKKLKRALKAYIEPEAFEKMQGTSSFPFKAGKHNRIAVKVIDFRGNEVMNISPIEGVEYGR